MILLKVAQLTKHYGPEPVLDGVTFELRQAEKCALVGPNGSGKTTLLKILAELEEADGGQFEVHDSARIGFLEQQPRFAPGQTVWREATDALAELTDMVRQAEQLAAQIADCDDHQQRQRLGDRYDRLHQQLQQRDGYHLDHKIERILEGLGLGRETFAQPVEQLSGGQQNRLLMAKLLLSEPDVMLLDEPSNHLDIQATQWLEDFLRVSPSALIVVSHDRFFLDRVTQRTLELFRGTIDSFSGNFSAYTQQKAERLQVQRRTYEKQQTEVAKIRDFIRRHHYGQKHAQAEDRRKKLERIELVEQPREIEAPPMRFPSAARCGDVALRVERLAKSYDRSLFTDLTFDMLRGEKWGILGPNGCGKTTLLLCLMGRVSPDAGRAVLASGASIGYFDQHLSDLDEQAPVLEVIRPEGQAATEQARRGLLARFGLVGDLVEQPVANLSGGQRNRAALARLATTEANFLVLDEPTNHLDLWSRGALESALRQFDGTVLCVSHDRYFLNQVVDHILVADDGPFRVFEGNYDSYVYWRDQQAGELRTSDTKPGKSEGSTRRHDQESASKSGRRKRRFPYRKVDDLEAEIAACEDRIEQLHTDMVSPEVLRDGQRVKQTQAELQQQQEALQTLYEHWEEALELN
jgi:ATP-binding cassette subfamily F protein 3